MIATIDEQIVRNNAGATIPVMSSSLSHEMYISVATPVSISMANAIADSFNVLRIAV